MHISSCLHPKTIVNPYTKERQVVSCGECAACRNRQSQIWCQRLDQERYCWKYCWFFTLTYNEDNVPTLINQNGIYIPTDTRHINPDSVLPCYNYWDNSPKLDASEVINMKSFMTSYDKCYYVSRYDVQCFMKRLRINLKRLFQSEKNYLNEKDYKVRYYISSEYGPKGKPYRPHYHGLLFFNSSFTAANIHSLLLKSWKYGFVNSSPVSETNSHYVASYLNCVADLPHIYKKGYFRPFALMSKTPPIGSLCTQQQEIRTLFDTCSPTFVIADHSKGLFDNVPLWRNYKDSLYPRLSGFDEITHYDRITLYGVFKRLSSKVDLDYFGASSFMSVMRLWHEKGDNIYHLSTVCLDYVDFLFRRTGNYQPVMRWWYISSRVCEQARVFNISLSDYINHIEKFYENCQSYNLDKFYNFQEDYALKYGSQSLIGLDSLYLRSLIGLDISQLCAEDYNTLLSYGIDIDKFFSFDPSISQEYIETLLPENTYDYLCFKIDSECKRKKHQRTKDKNETIDNTICGF